MNWADLVFLHAVLMIVAVLLLGAIRLGVWLLIRQRGR